MIGECAIVSNHAHFILNKDSVPKHSACETSAGVL
jgi:hypothetical protein